MKTFTTKYGSILAGLLASKYGVNAMDMDEKDMTNLFEKNNWPLPEVEDPKKAPLQIEAPAPEEPVEGNDCSLEEKSEEELREMAKDAGIRGYHNMKKETLLKKLQ